MGDIAEATSELAQTAKTGPLEQYLDESRRLSHACGPESWATAKSNGFQEGSHTLR